MQPREEIFSFRIVRIDQLRILVVYTKVVLVYEENYYSYSNFIIYLYVFLYISSIVLQIQQCHFKVVIYHLKYVSICYRPFFLAKRLHGIMDNYYYRKNVNMYFSKSFFLANTKCWIQILSMFLYVTDHSF